MKYNKHESLNFTKIMLKPLSTTLVKEQIQNSWA